MNNLLVITPGYISHYCPMVKFINKLIDKIECKVYVATDKGIKDIVLNDGFEFIDMSVWESNNPGKVDMDKQTNDEAKRLQDSYRATYKGMVGSLMFQAENREHDLLWEPQRIMNAVEQILKEYSIDLTICVQLCYNATAALMALNAPFITYVTGHPDQLPLEHEIYGVPYRWPSEIRCDPEELEKLKTLCVKVQETVTTEFNGMIQSKNKNAKKLKNAFSACSDRMVLFNYPKSLVGNRSSQYSNSFYLGASVQTIKRDEKVTEWLANNHDDRPLLYVSFGTVFSVRGDVLSKIYRALNKKYRVIVSTGVLEEKYKDYIDAEWLAMEFLPQLQVLENCDLLIGHGGNNSITEALYFGVPVISVPFASDQFFSANAVKENEIGGVIDPNNFEEKDVIECVEYALTCKNKAIEVSKEIRSEHEYEHAIEYCIKEFGLN